MVVWFIGRFYCVCGDFFQEPFPYATKAAMSRYHLLISVSFYLLGMLMMVVLKRFSKQILVDIDGYEMFLCGSVLLFIFSK